MTLLKDKVVFITGGSTGIGWVCAQRYALQGARVAIAAIDREEVERAAKELGGEHLGLVCDVRQQLDVERAIDQTLGQFGRLDAVHNNAGIATPSKAMQ